MQRFFEDFAKAFSIKTRSLVSAYIFLPPRESKEIITLPAFSFALA